MAEPVIAQKSPFPVDVKSGQKYFWCACGRSKKQPFCDGSHSGTEFQPSLYEATEDKRLFFCGCKKSNQSPLCDGTHNNL
jgi:CDGSH-type Zn-finger protein